jgi:hypothetical protein
MTEKKNGHVQPELTPVTVRPQKLLLWPNNPRLYSGTMVTVPEAEFIDGPVQDRARKGMNHKSFRIGELKASIRRNGFVPVDYIFVRKYGDAGHYLVLEGNRRATAIFDLLDEEDLDPKARGTIEKLECMEITNELEDAELEKLISKLLGVRHHGSLKKWSKFAQAAHAHDRYCTLAAREDGAFEWDEALGQQVADELCLDTKTLRELLATYCAMVAISKHGPIAEVGGVAGGHYSLICDSLVRGAPHLREYLVTDALTFEPDMETIGRLDVLCRFSKGPKRFNAPIEKPGDWRSLAKILKDDDSVKRDEMMNRVMTDGENPRAVWDDRERELKQEDWGSWIHSVLQVVGGIELGAIEGTAEERDVVVQLDALLLSLNR